MVGVCVVGDSLVVNKAFDLFHSSGQAWAGANWIYVLGTAGLWLTLEGHWLNLFLAEDVNKDAEDVSGAQQS